MDTDKNSSSSNVSNMNKASGGKTMSAMANEVDMVDARRLKAAALQWKRPTTQKRVNEGMCSFLKHMHKYALGQEIPPEIVNMALEGLAVARKLTPEQTRAIRGRASRSNALMMQTYKLGIVLGKHGIRACKDADETFKVRELRQLDRHRSSGQGLKRIHEDMPVEKLSPKLQEQHREIGKVITQSFVAIEGLAAKFALPAARSAGSLGTGEKK